MPSTAAAGPPTISAGELVPGAGDAQPAVAGGAQLSTPLSLPLGASVSGSTTAPSSGQPGIFASGSASGASAAGGALCSACCAPVDQPNGGVCGVCGALQGPPPEDAPFASALEQLKDEVESLTLSKAAPS
eukprot:TRINITY_DN62749_c0_g1_i1.p3 TRINITY_DN62749_c0_g1~~TRINITY_DN62749_c0_g1_i1.p3  ORF type:complete len:131 (+),score=19.10 TRINITY_DN62749_c0_g1_i1:72-464(+)